MGLKVVHINTTEIRKEAEAKALWDDVLQPKWEEQARDRVEKLLARLNGTKYKNPGPPMTKVRG